MLKDNKRKILFMLIITIMVVLFPIMEMQKLAYAEESSKLELDDMIEKTYKYYKDKKTALTSWEEIVAIASTGENVTQSPWELPDWKSEELEEDGPTVYYAGYILGMMAKGEDPTDIWDRNLVAELKEKQQPNGAFDTINGHIWAVIALDAADADYNKAGAIEYLINQQKDDGGYAYGEDDTPEQVSEPDMTGMALVALANHRDIEGVDETIEKVLAYLKENQLPTGGFESWGTENANSVAAVISGLVAVGEDVFSGPWIKDGNTMLDALQAFMLDDGSFTYTLSPKESNDMATYQAFIALNELKSKRSIWRNLSITPEKAGNDEKEDEKNLDEKEELKTQNKEKEVQSSEKKDKQISIYIVLAVLLIGVVIYLLFSKRQTKK